MGSAAGAIGSGIGTAAGAVGSGLGAAGSAVGSGLGAAGSALGSGATAAGNTISGALGSLGSSLFPGAGLASAGESAATAGSLGAIPELGMAEGVVMGSVPNALGGTAIAGQAIPGATALAPVSGELAGGVLASGLFPGTAMQAGLGAAKMGLKGAQKGASIADALTPGQPQQQAAPVVTMPQRPQAAFRPEAIQTQNVGLQAALRRISESRLRQAGGIVKAF